MRFRSRAWPMLSGLIWVLLLCVEKHRMPRSSSNLRMSLACPSVHSEYGPKNSTHLYPICATARTVAAASFFNSLRTEYNSSPIGTVFLARPRTANGNIADRARKERREIEGPCMSVSYCKSQGISAASELARAFVCYNLVGSRAQDSTKRAP